MVVKENKAIIHAENLISGHFSFVPEALNDVSVDDKSTSLDETSNYHSITSNT
jgi:hypothetical protein